MDQPETKTQPFFPQILPTQETKIAIATSTLYPKWYPESLRWHYGEKVTAEVNDKVRGDLALETVRETRNRLFQLVVVDGSDNPLFSQNLREYTSPYPQKDLGISSSRQQAFEKIIQNLPGTEVISTFEPEKVSVIRDCLNSMVLPVLAKEADLVVPARDEKAFDTYPIYQSEIEQEGNYQWNKLLREEGILRPNQPDLDKSFGPVAWIFSLTGIYLRRYRLTDPNSPLASDLKPDEYCNALIFPLVAALTENKKVLKVIVSYKHPEIQKAIEQNSAEFRKKREYQQRTIQITTREYIKLLRGEPSLLALI